MSNNKVKIRIKNNQGDIETVWADSIGNNQYKLDSSPFFAYGISWQDTVEALPANDGVLEFKKIIKKSGHKTVRVLSETKEISKKLIDEVISLGCSIEKANEKFIVIDVPENVSHQNLIDLVVTSEYRWEYADPTYEDINN